MLKGELNQIMVNTAISIQEVQPTRDGAVLRVCFAKCTSKLHRLLRAPCDSRQKGSLDGRILISIILHIQKPPALHDRGKNLTNAECEGYWPEILNSFSSLSRSTFENEAKHSIFPGLRNCPRHPTVFVNVHQCCNN